MEVEQQHLNIQTTQNSRLSQIDWDNLPFGKIFSDHMFCMEYANGEWTKQEIAPYENISLSPATSDIHYGQRCFEGMKAHRNEKGEVVLFRPYDNAKRFNQSAIRMCMPTIPEDLFVNALKELLKVDHNWVPKNPSHSLYIRPFMFATDPYVGIRPSESYDLWYLLVQWVLIILNQFLLKLRLHIQELLLVEQDMQKQLDYATALYPAKQAQDEGYKQLIWTDAKEHRYIEEAGTMNVMFVMDGKLITP